MALYVAASGLDGRSEYQTGLIFADHFHDLKSYCQPQVAADCRQSPAAESTINPTKGGGHPQFSSR